MDIETSEAIGTLRADLRHVEDHLGGRIDGVERRLTLRIDGIDARIDGIDAKIDRVDSKIDRVEATLRVEMGKMREDMRRHFEIATESLRDDVRIIAEGLIALGAKVDRLLPPDSLH
jgi:archaellum component FlaC